MASRRPTAPSSGGGRRAPATAGAGPATGARSSGRRGGVRPAASRRPAPAARPRSAPAAPVSPPRGLSRRAAVLAGLLLVVGIAVSPFLRAAVSQQAELAALEHEVAEREQRVQELEQQVARWQDPAFVRAQARQRLKYVMPGEVGYIVLDDLPVDDAATADPSVVAAEDVGSRDRPWFGNLWESVQLAGAPEQPVSATEADPTAESKLAPSP